MKPVSSVSVTGTYVVTFNQPIVMCSSTLASLQSQLGVETIRLDSTANHVKSTTSSFYHLLLKNSSEWKKVSSSSAIPSSSFSDVPYSVVTQKSSYFYSNSFILLSTKRNYRTRLKSIILATQQTHQPCYQTKTIQISLLLIPHLIPHSI